MNNVGLQQAEEMSKLSLSTYARFVPESMQFGAELNVSAVIQESMGYLLEAEKLHRKSLDLAIASGDLAGQMGNLNNLGTIAFLRGDLVEATHYLERSASVLSQMPAPKETWALMFTNLGTLFDAQGRFEESEYYSRRALELLKNSKSLDEARALSNLGSTMLDQEKLEEAKRYCQKGSAILESIAPKSLLASSLRRCLAGVSSASGDSARAQEYAEQALRLADAAAPDSLHTADALVQLARILRERNDLKSAETYVRRAIAIYERLSPDSEFRAEALHHLALVRRAEGTIAEAIELAAQAITVLESQISRGHTSEVDRRFHRSSRRDIYLNYVDLLVQSDAPERAFSVLERWRAGAFLALITERDLVFSDIPPDLDRERRRIAVEYDRVLRRLAEHAATEEETVAARAQLTAWRARYQEVNRMVRNASPRLDSLRYPQPLNFHAAQTSLDRGTLLLSFAVYTDHTLLFVITSQGPLRIIRLDTGEKELQRDIVGLRRMLLKAQESHHIWRHQAAQSISQRLYNRLFEPVAVEMATASRLVIVPDGSLHILPWGALVRKVITPDSPPHYLVDWKPLHITLSATVYPSVALRDVKR